MRMESAVSSHGCLYNPIEFNGYRSELRKWRSRGVVQGGRRNGEVVFGKIRIRNERSVMVRMKGASVEGVDVVEKLSLGAFEVLRGSALPFGATAVEDGVNFAICSTNAAKASICLMTKEDLLQGNVTHELPLEPANHRTGDVWHAFLKGGFQDMVYGFRFDGKFSPEDGHHYDPSHIVLDPYAKVSVF